MLFGMKINIRPIQESDNPELSKIIKAVFEEFDAPKEGTVYVDPTTDDLFSLFKEKRSACFVGEIDGQVMGACGIFPTSGLDKDYCELVKFYLRKEARGLGLGKQLMEQCEIAAIELKYQKIYLESFPEFGKAVGMYQKAGYKSIDHALGNTGHFGCSIFMIKSI